MKEQIFEKIKNALVCYNIANQNVNEAYDVLISSNPPFLICFQDSMD